jgi:hypothetical protein
MSGGSGIFLAFLILFLASVVWGLFTRAGSAISQRPYGKVYSGAPGARIENTLDHDHSAAAELRRPRR